jgi:hypothetical protein
MIQVLSIILLLAAVGAAPIAPIYVNKIESKCMFLLSDSLYLGGQSLYRDGDGHHQEINHKGHHSGEKRKYIGKHGHDRDWDKDLGHGGEIKLKGHHSGGWHFKS